MAEPEIPVKVDHLCCRVCWQLFRDPVTVPCGHNFCKPCIQDRWDHMQRSGGLCSCPQCSYLFPSRPQLIENTTLSALVRDSSEKRKQQPSEVSSQDVKRVCTDAPASGGALAESRGSVPDVYCCTDEQIISVVGAAEHPGHTHVSVREGRRRKQEELENLQIRSKEILQEQEAKCKRLEKTLGQVKEEVRETEDYCECILASVIDSLQGHFLPVTKLIGSQAEVVTAQIQTSLQTLQGKMEKMRKRSAELDHLAQSESDVHFLQEWPSLRRLCENEHLHPSQEDSEDPLLPFKSTTRAVELIGKHLTELADKEFAAICQTDDRGELQESRGESGGGDTMQECEASTSQSHGLSERNITMNEHDVEPQTRAEFLLYACDLRLDPATAHNDLVISEGDKEVKLIPQMCKSPGVRNPGKFVHRRQVLCRQGLQAERCYYEIEIQGDKVEIALAYKRIDRKSSSKISAFGGNADSWSLDRSKFYSVSHRDKSIRLTASPNLHRIGVYLKFKEGTLSFYEVSEASDSMVFLYKVETEFKEPLYPGFWLGEKCCIRVCDLS